MIPKGANSCNFSFKRRPRASSNAPSSWATSLACSGLPMPRVQFPRRSCSWGIRAVCAGRRRAWLPTRPHLVTAYGLHAAAIDSPGHGDRERSPEDAVGVDQLLRAREAGEPLGPIVSAFNASIAERAVPEWQATLDALQALPEIDDTNRSGTAEGRSRRRSVLRLAVAEPRVGVLGLGAAFASTDLLVVARGVSVPVLYLLPFGRPRDRPGVRHRALGLDRVGDEVVARVPRSAPARAIVRG